MLTKEEVAQWLKDHHKTHAWLAVQLGLTRPAVSMWLAGKMKFSEEILRKLERVVK
jgi:predicted transcriptional regulator